MRALVVAIALLVPIWAGCINPTTDTLTGASAQLGIIEIPAGAVLVDEPGRAILRWVDVDLPFKQTFVVPSGTTIVRAIGDVGDKLSVSATMWNEDTGRRRCNTDRLDLWNLPVTGVSACSGMAAIDPPGTKWVASVTGPLNAVATVDIIFETAPVDGIVADLDLTRLSMPTHELEDTQYQTVPSFDGVPLWTEVTLPVGDGPWPTILAASPYNGQSGRGELPAMWTYFTHDWAKRGYAVVNVDVRGFGMSGGCVEIWSENEQKDQAFMVDWVAQQPWSDGNVGFYGQSYVATTPVAAAVLQAPALKAIIAVAPVINAYNDWHYGGVPNGENTGSVAAYQVLTDLPPTPDQNPGAFFSPQTLVTNKVKGICDPTIVAEANDPRAIYNAFYEERNFAKGAGDITAAVLYTQGFEDSNVKSAMIPGWFNEIQSKKLGLFGHWVHQHPTRADEEILFLGWMDEHVKGIDLGFSKLPNVDVVADNTRHRTADVWPPVDAPVLALQTDLAGGKLAPEASGGAVDIALAGQAQVASVAATAGTKDVLTLVLDVEEAFALAGGATLSITGTLKGSGNGYVVAEMFDDGDKVTYGMFNIAHRNGHDSYAPATATETVTFALPFLPTEHVFEAGHKLRLVIRGINAGGDGLAVGGQPGVFTLQGGDKTHLLLPTVDLAEYAPLPATATR